MWTRYGSTLIMVTNIDGSKEYKVISHSYYQTIKKTKNFDKFKGSFAILYPDNKLVIPDTHVKKVNVLIFSLDETCNDLSDCEEGSGCGSYWEKEIEISDKIGEIAIQETLKEVSMRLQIPKDENPNNDSNIKSKEQ